MSTIIIFVDVSGEYGRTEEEFTRRKLPNDYGAILSSIEKQKFRQVCAGDEEQKRFTTSIIRLRMAAIYIINITGNFSSSSLFLFFFIVFTCRRK